MTSRHFLLFGAFLFTLGCSQINVEKELSSAQKEAKNGNWAQALAIINCCQDAMPENPDVLAMKALSMFQTSGKDPQIVQQCLDLLRQAGTLAEDRYDIAYLEGWMLLSINRTAEAQAPLEKALSLYTQDIEKKKYPDAVAGALHCCLGECYMKNNRYADAIESLQKALKYSPYAPTPNDSHNAMLLECNIAVLYYQNAMLQQNTAARIRNHVQAYNHITQAYRLGGKDHLETAVNLAILADQLAPQYPQLASGRIAHYNRALLLARSRLQATTDARQKNSLQALLAKLNRRMQTLRSLPPAPRNPGNAGKAR